MVRRVWKDALAKMDGEKRRCRVCSKSFRVECAHVSGRDKDADIRPGWKYVHPDDVIPLCGPATDTGTCHGSHHAGTLDLRPYLTEAEKARVLFHARTQAGADRVMMGSRLYREAS